jgi:hypothetical protein
MVELDRHSISKLTIRCHHQRTFTSHLSILLAASSTNEQALKALVLQFYASSAYLSWIRNNGNTSSGRGPGATPG